MNLLDSDLWKLGVEAGTAIVGWIAYQVQQLLKRVRIIERTVDLTQAHLDDHIEHSDTRHKELVDRIERRIRKDD